MARMTDENIRRSFLARFGRMTKESQDAVIEALEVVRDCTHPEEANEPEESPPLKMTA